MVVTVLAAAAAKNPVVMDIKTRSELIRRGMKLPMKPQVGSMGFTQKYNLNAHIKIDHMGMGDLSVLNMVLNLINK